MDLKLEEWKAVTDYLNQHYYKPDTESLLAALAIYVSHLQLDNPPVWSFFIGPPGTGKTELICNAIEVLPHTKVVSEMSTASLVSGLKTDDGGSSLLFNLTRYTKNPYETHGVLVFKDFTSVLGERPDTKAKLVSQLRQVYDGHFSSIKGTVTKEWRGKVTCIAAVTPTIERQWSTLRELGERFNQYRWSTGDGVQTALKAATHYNHKKVMEEYGKLVKKFINIKELKHVTDGPDPLELVYLAHMTSVLRGPVIRDTQQRDLIIDIPEPEAPTRLIKSMIQIARASATIFGRSVCSSEDIGLAKRMSIDSIPIIRLKILNSIEGETKQRDIEDKTEIPETTVTRVCSDLIAIKALKSSFDGKDTLYTFTKKFLDLRNKALGKDNLIQFPKLKEVK